MTKVEVLRVLEQVFEEFRRKMTGSSHRLEEIHIDLHETVKEMVRQEERVRDSMVNPGGVRDV